MGVNPYTPPGAAHDLNIAVPAGARRGALPSRSLLVAKVVLGSAAMASISVAAILIGVGVVLGPQAGKSLLDLGLGLAVLGELFATPWLIAWLVAIYRFWSWFPPEHRYTSLWRRYISPAAAAWFMLVPFFGLFWMFVIYLGMGEVLSRLRNTYPTKKAPSSGLALATLLIGFVFTPAFPILDFLFDRQTDGLAREIEAQLVRAEEAPR